MSLLDLSCEHQTQRLGQTEVEQHLASLHNDWNIASGKLQREFMLGNYTETLAFVNQIAAIADQQDHHPDICFGYRNCIVTYSTHSVDGLSINDFICAAHIDKAAAA